MLVFMTIRQTLHTKESDKHYQHCEVFSMLSHKLWPARGDHLADRIGALLVVFPLQIGAAVMHCACPDLSLYQGPCARC